MKDVSDSNIGFENHVEFVPPIDPLYVPFGNFVDIENIIKSEIFYPVYISGLSGNGKTSMVEQICAKTGRKIVRVNFTKNTDEDDLFGGFRLVNGETVWFDGPVIKAMRVGAVLLLDEIDLSSVSALCLQPVLEGKNVLLKKINCYVTPLKGFNIIATANTKGKGSEDGKFMGANILNEAFLERFAVTFEQEYPTVATEKKILSSIFESCLIEDNQFVDYLTQWSSIARKTYFDGGLNEIISTRRLVHIARAFSIFKDHEKAIQLCLNRFDSDTKHALLKVYKSIVKPEPEPIVEEKSSLSFDELPELEPF